MPSKNMNYSLSKNVLALAVMVFLFTLLTKRKRTFENTMPISRAISRTTQT